MKLNNNPRCSEIREIINDKIYLDVRRSNMVNQKKGSLWLNFSTPAIIAAFYL
jgi:hypothetical protein